MSIEELSQEEELELALEEDLQDFCADLVTENESKIFLTNLFTENSGEWIDVTCLCDGLEEIQTRLEQIEERLGDNLQVSWLDYSHGNYGDGFCTILFFVESLLWTNVVIYNKQSFIKEHAI